MSTEGTIIHQSDSDSGGDSDALSPAEQAYFSSRGEDLSGFEAEDSQPAQAPVAEPAPDAGGDSEGDDYEGEELVTLGPDGKPRDDKGRFVPHQALHKERERRKAIESENLSMREKIARADERLAVLNEMMIQAEQGQQPQQQQRTPEEELGPAPDPNEDVFAYMQWQGKALELQKRQIEELRNGVLQDQSQRQQQMQAAQVQQRYEQDALSYIQKQPDFPQAYTYLAQAEAAALKSRGFNDEQIRERLQRAEAEIVQDSFQNGVSPAQAIYDEARRRGYTPSQAAQAAGKGDAAKQKLEQVRKGQQATKSLSNAGGTSAEGLTYEALADMDEDSFFQLHEKLGRNKLRSLLGG